MDCIIFDLDGTLVDSERLGMRTLLELEPDIGFSVDAMTTAYRGWRLATVLGDIETRLGRSLPPDFEATYRARLATIFDSELAAFPGVEAALAGLSAPMCIASSGPLKKIRQSLGITGLDRFFGDNTFSAYDIGAWKPDPALFLHAAAAMGVSPAGCIVVEDSAVGLQAAEAAGMRAVQFCPDLAPDHSDARRFNDYGRLAAVLDGVAG